MIENKLNNNIKKYRKDEAIPKLDTRITNHGVKGVELMQQIHSYYGLNLVPFSLSIEAIIMNGSTIIKKVETKRIPFQNSCKYN